MDPGPFQGTADGSLDLVRRVQQGDGGALDELYRRHRDPMLFAIRARLGPRLRQCLESEDVLQSVFKDALSDIRRFEPRESGSLARWLHACVLNKIRSKAEHFDARKRSGAVPLSDSVAERAAGAAEVGYLDAARWEGLERALARLEPEAREAVILRTVEGLSNEDAARALGRTPAATSKLYTRALARLGVLLADPGERAVSRLEDLVVEFLERRAAQPDLTPAAFARERGDVAGLEPALRAALEAVELLGRAANPRPEAVGPYRVVRELGRGGMGVVYEAERAGERVAVKVLLGARLASARSLERFRREAAALRRVDHPGVVRVREEGTVDGVPWIAMDLVEGRPLVRGGETDARAAAGLVRVLAEAVHAVHASGVLHRDLKPSNVLVRADGSPVLCDFGLVQTDDDETLTSTGELLGTPRYMAPEQVLGRACDARTDVHALGLILYELTCGEPARRAESREEVLHDVARGEVRRPRRVARDVPRALERVILQATAADPARRYASAAALAEDLQRFLEGRAVRARPPGFVARAWARARAAPRTAAGLALLALGLVAALAALWGAERPGAPTAELARAVDRAAWAWIEGQDRLARHYAQVARGLAPADGDVRALADRIEGGEPAPGSGALDALGGVAAQVPALASARSARTAGRADDARAALEAARLDAPGSAALAAELGWALSELGRADEAGAQFGRAIALDPENPLAHEAASAWSFERGDLRAGFLAARRAAALLAEQGEPPTRLGKLLERTSDAPALQAILQEHVAAHPDDDDVRFALAVALDRDHALGAAAREYAELVRRRPDHAWALAYLAYLQLGALGERCARCVEAYARAPEVRDDERGARNLVRALHADAGRDEDLLRTIVSIALDKELGRPVAAELSALLETRERSARTARLESALHRFE